MHPAYTAMPRSVPLGACESGFSRQEGPHCKVYALALVHHVLCACNQFPLYKNGDQSVLSARRIAKLCGSAVGEIASLQQLDAVANRVGLTTETAHFETYESMISILTDIFASNRHVMFFVQLDRDTCSYPSAKGCDEQYFEHGLVCSGWSPVTKRLLARSRSSDKQHNDGLDVLCYNPNGQREIYRLKHIFESACQVTTCRKKERFYKHFIPKNAPANNAPLIAENTWLDICNKGGECRWHDYDQMYECHLANMTPEQQSPQRADRLFKQIQRGDDPNLMARESTAQNGDFHKRIVVFNLARH